MAKDIEHKDGDPYNIIVSRSHSGDVEPVVKKSLGKDTKVIPAGGAGLSTFTLTKLIHSSILYLTCHGGFLIYICLYCIGYKTWEVIKGEASAYVHVTRIKKWDICAGNAILDTVGGKMTTLQGDTIDYSAAGDPVNDNGLLAVLKDHDIFLKAIGPHFDKLKNTEKTEKKKTEA